MQEELQVWIWRKCSRRVVAVYDARRLESDYAVMKKGNKTARQREGDSFCWNGGKMSRQCSQGESQAALVDYRS